MPQIGHETFRSRVPNFRLTDRKSFRSKAKVSSSKTFWSWALSSENLGFWKLSEAVDNWRQTSRLSTELSTACG